ncbi:hypothetical protein [Streptomyces zingiberis]|uniref:Cellulose synthase n=1 Tax=Streptomyces zingiberis TaxID=2053010 RepID=A0ABX1BYJ5_9ACTN|nr:hypothetical protein [Streptomyces zingiberis]NJQ01483.1 hypothetical protein [Streptomyces zingiberis]
MLTTTVCIALSAAGLAAALLTAWRRRFLAATRIAALALVPVGLAMAGLVDLAKDIAVAAADWAAGLVLRPSVWAGFAVLGVSAVLFVAARVAGRRRRGAGGRAAVEPGTRAPSLGPGHTAGSGEGAGAAGRAAPAARPRGGRDQGTGLEDFEDIEAILKKHGI